MYEERVWNVFLVDEQNSEYICLKKKKIKQIKHGDLNNRQAFAH